jgi:hypothetical protein
MNKPPCPACNAAYRREALTLMQLLAKHAPPGAWPPSAMREAVGTINNDPEPYAWVTCFRATLHDDGVDVSHVPTAQPCFACAREDECVQERERVDETEYLV